MERIAELTAILRREVNDYVWDQDDSNAYLLENSTRRLFAVLVVPKAMPQQSLTIIVARIEGDMVIIETDLTDRPLYQELVRVGIPREQIICAYAGEKTHPS